CASCAWLDPCCCSPSEPRSQTHAVHPTEDVIQRRVGGNRRVCQATGTLRHHLRILVGQVADVDEGLHLHGPPVELVGGGRIQIERALDVVVVDGRVGHG